MTTKFKRVHIPFDSSRGGPQAEIRTAVFSSRVRTAAAVLEGYRIRFDNGDHHILEQMIDVDVVDISGNTVRVKGDFSLRDGSGTFDDPYSGWISCLVIAEVA